MKSIFTLVFLSLSLIATAQQKQDTVDFDKAYDLMLNEKYSSALMLINPLITAHPKIAEYYSLRGMIYEGMESAQDAMADYSTAILFDPHSSIYYSQRGQLYYRMQFSNESIQDYDSALVYEHVDTMKYALIANRGTARQQKRDFQGAYNDYIQQYNFDSTSLQALTLLGAVLDDLGREKEAMKYLESAVRLYPTEIAAIGNLGFRYSSMGEYPKALAMYNKLLTLYPKSAIGLNNRGFILYKMNKLEEALKDINESIELYPANSYAFKNRALVYIAMKQKDKACSDLKDAIKLRFTEQYGDEVDKLIRQHCMQ